MWKELKNACRKLIRDRPGRRFLNFHRRWHRQVKGPGLSIAMVVIGLVLVAGGVVFGFFPVIPGFVFVLPGIAMIVAPFRPPAEWLDRTEVAIRRTWRKLRHRAVQP